MQILKRSFKNQLILSLLLFAVLSILVSVSFFIAIDKLYRNRISIEIESLTEIIAQNIDNFFQVPDEFLIGIRDHIDEVHIHAEIQDPNCIIIDLIDFVKTFESVYLLDHSGGVLNTWPYDENYLNIDMSNHEYFINGMKTDNIYWSDTFFSKKTGLPTVALTIKCNKGLVVAYYNLTQLNNFISIRMSTEEDFISVLDAEGNIIALTGSVKNVVTDNLNNMPSVRAAKAGRYGVFEDYFQGTRGLVSVKRSEDSRFIVLVFKAYYHIFQNLYTIYALFFGVLTAVTILFLVVIFLFFRKFLKPLIEFQNTSRQVASGSYEQLPESKFIEFEQLKQNFTTMIERIKKREASLKTSINERDTLLRELNHRTKNNMQLITGFMKLYHLNNPDSDPYGIMTKIQSKIETISLVHEKLYRSSDLSRINFRDYIEELIPVMINSLSDPSTRIEYSIEIEDIYLLLDYAVPCGLILNEFIINSLKYAFNDKDHGLIEIKSRMNDGILVVSYSDDGVGLPASLDPAGSESLGLSIVHNIAKSQLRGDIQILPSDGFSCTFSFGLDTYTSRI